jgi:hypothetical protein
MVRVRVAVLVGKNVRVGVSPSLVGVSEAELVGAAVWVTVAVATGLAFGLTVAVAVLVRVAATAVSDAVGEGVPTLVPVAVGLLGTMPVLVAVAAAETAVVAVAVGVGFTSARDRATKSGALSLPSPLTSAVEQSLLPTNTAPASAPTSAEFVAPSQLASPTTV